MFFIRNKGKCIVRFFANNRLLSMLAVLTAILLPLYGCGGGDGDSASAGGPSSGCVEKPVSENRNADRGSLKGFADPDTGEIITYEEARRAGIADHAREASSGEARATAEVVREIRLGKRVPLEGGGYIAEVVSPRPRAELKARISADGETEILCHRRAEKASAPKGGGRE